MYCTKCGKLFEGDGNYCDECKQQMNETMTKPIDKQSKCTSAFILGLIGSIFGMLGGINTTMFSFGGSNKAFIFLFGGSVVGLIGACLCRKKANIGSIIELIGALMIIIRAFGHGSTFFCVIALLLLLTGGIIGFIYSNVINGGIKKFINKNK